MSLSHRAPIGALRTQAGVKRSETPVKRRYQQNRVPKVRQKFCRPYRGLQSARTSFAGVQRSGTPACVLIVPSVFLHLPVFSLSLWDFSPACVLIVLSGLCPPACILIVLSGLWLPIKILTFYINNLRISYIF